MHKIFFFIIGVCMFPFVLPAQVTNVVFLGSVSVEGGENYPYKLYVTDSNDVLYGYSVTDITGPNETKTSVVGKINSSKKQITFREKKIIYTRTTDKNTDFCFIDAHLKATKIQGATTLRGKFTGYKKDGVTKCGSGKIMLVCAEDLLDKLLKIAEKENIQRTTDTVATIKETKVVHESSIDEKKVLKLAPGKTVELAVTSGMVEVDVWDAKNIDGDIITLMSDDKVLLNNYKLSGHHKILTLNMGEAKTKRLRLIAINEGSEPTSTARIRVATENETYFIDASTTMGKDVEIVINDTRTD